MLSTADVDVVFVLTPIQLHHEHTMACLHAGKHVYVQKTMALTHEQAREMVETAETNALTLAAAPGQMLSPAYQQMRRIVEDGGVGRVMWCCGGAAGGDATEVIGSDGVDGAWRFHHGGGPLWNTTVYSLHALTGILGPIRRVGSMMQTPFPQRMRGGVPFDVTETDNALLTLEFASGVLGCAWGCRSATGQVLDWGAIGLYGTGGSLEATGIHHESGWPDEVAWRGRERRVFRYPKGGFLAGEGWETPLAPPPHPDLLEQHVYLDALDFVQAVRANRPPLASAHHAAHVVEVIEKSYLAARSGRHQDIHSKFWFGVHTHATSCSQWSIS
jgi:predicted dehydrogenase